MKRLAIGLVICSCLLALATTAFAQTVRLQDRASPNTAVVTSAGALLVDTTGTGVGTAGLTCTSRVAISQTGNTQIITGVANQRTYFCAMFLISADAKNLSIVEGTGATCGTGTVGIIGGTSASAALSANGGFVLSATTAFARSAVATNICILQSTAGNVSGIVTFIQQ